MRAVLVCSLALLVAQRQAQAQAVRYLPGHDAPVYAVAYTPDGKTLVSAGLDGAVLVWDRAAGTEICRFNDLGSPALSVAISRDNLRLLVGTRGGQAKLYDLPQRDPLATFGAFSGPPSALALSADGKSLFMGDRGLLVRLWTQPGLQPARDYPGVTAPVTALTAAGAHVVAASADGSVRGWNVDNAQPAGVLWTSPVNSLLVDAASKTLVAGSVDGGLRKFRWPPVPPQTLAGNVGAVNALAVTPGGKQILAACGDGVTRVFSVANGQVVGAVPGGNGEATAVAALGDGKLAVVGAADGTLKLFALADQKVLAAWGGHTGRIARLIANPVAGEFASAGADGTIRTWRVPPQPTLLPGHDAAIQRVAATADGKLMVTASGGTIRLFNADGKLTATLPAGQQPITALSLRADGNQLAVGDAAGVVKLWNIPAGKPAGELLAHGGAVTGVALSAAGDELVSTGADGVLKHWRLPLIAETTFTGHQDVVTAVAIGRDGKLTVSASADGSVRLLDANLKPQRALDEKLGPQTAVALAPAGDYAIAGAANGELRVWPVAGGAAIVASAGTATINSVAFAPSGKQFATASADGVTRLWDLSKAPLAATRVLAGHTGAVNGVAFTPDGTTLLTCGADHTARAWRIADGAELRAYAGAGDALSAVAVSADGAHVTASGNDRAVRVWNFASGALEATLNHPAAVATVSFASHASRLVTGGQDGIVRLWDAAANRELQRWAAQPAAIRTVASTADGQTILVGGADKTVRRLVPAARSVVMAHEGGASALVAFGAEGSVLTAGADRLVKLWGRDGKLIRQCAGSDVVLNHIAVDAAGQNIYAGGDAAQSGKRWFAWRLDNAQLLRAVDVPAAVTDVAISPDGRKLMVACADGKLRIFDPADGRLLEDVQHTGPVLSAAFIGNDRILCGGGDAKAAVYSRSAVSVFVGPPGAISGLAYAAGGKQLVSTSPDRVVRVWDLPAGKQLRQFAPAAVEMRDLAVATKAGLVATVGAEPLVRLWKLANGSPAKQIALPAPASAVAFSPDGSRLAVMCDDRQVRLFDVARGMLLEQFPRAAPGTAVLFSPDGEWIASGQADGGLFRETPSAIAAAQTHTKAIRTVISRKAADEIITAGDDGALAASKLSTLAPVRRQELGSALLAAASADAQRLAIATAAGEMRLASAEGKTLASAKMPIGCTAIALDAAGERIFVASEDKLLRIYALASAGGQQLRLRGVSAGHADRITALTFNADGRTATSISLDGTAKTWQVPAPRARATFEHSARVYATAFNADATLAVTGGADNKVKIWKTADGALVGQCQGHTDQVMALSCDVAGKRLASCGLDGTVRLWDFAGQPLTTMRGPTAGPLYSVAFSPVADQLLAAGVAPQWITWNPAAETPPRITSGGGDAIFRVVYQKAGARAVTLDYSGGLDVWDIASGTLVYHRQLPQAVTYGCDWSPDGSEVAVATADHRVMIVTLPPSAR